MTETLPDRWLATVCRSLPGDRDDLIQEGRIAAWKASLKSNGTNQVSFMKKAAAWRMKDVAFGKAPLGSPRTHGSNIKTVALPDDSYIWENCVHYDRPRDLAYHYDEIQAAISGLTPNQRKYVFLRFWVGMNTTELDEHFGYACSPIWTKIKRVLAEHLAHLEGAV